MSASIDDFFQRATAFARTFPEATLAMPAPELAVDDRARARHLKRTCERVRARMMTTARLALRQSCPSTPDLFTIPACAAGDRSPTHAGE